MQQAQTDDLGFCPSFSCYSSDNPASTAATRISNQLHQQHAARFHDEDEFEFSSALGDDESSGEGTASVRRTDFPLFNRDLLIQNDVIGRGESASSSSDESDGESPAVFCVWRHKLDAGASPLSKCKKSTSTGSGSKRWRIRDLLRRSNSEGKEPVALLNNKKVDISKQKSSSGEVSTVAGKLKPSSPSIHEMLYAQRVKREGGKRKSCLPYRQGLVGLLGNVNGSGKKLPF